MSVVTLVHGTWATGAAWCLPQSKLCSVLRQTLGNDTIFVPFGWSGGNSHRSRIKGSIDLQKHIRVLKMRYPHDEQFLVAHSHGGNVCLYALRDIDVRKCITATVTMSTPFIVCRRRNLGASALPAIAAFLLGVLLLLCTPLLSNVPFIVRGFMSVGIFLGTLFALVGLDYLLRKRVFGGKSHAEIHASWEASLALPTLSFTELLVVRSPGDEASGALAVSHVVGWSLASLSRIFNAVFRVGEWIAGINSRYSPARRAAYAAGPLLLGTVALWFTFVDDVISNAELWAAVSLAGIILTAVGVGFIRAFGYDLYEFTGFVLQALCGALLLPIVIVLMLCVLPFGADTALFGVLFDLSAESAPPGTFTIAQSGESVDAGLSHSAPYNNDETLVEVATWIRDRVRPHGNRVGA